MGQRPPDIPGAVHRWVEIGPEPVRLHVAEAGDGPPVLMLHGWPQTFWCWRRVVRLLDELGIDRAFLVGHDWGGFSGFVACLRQPERFERFVALNTPVPWPELSPRLALDAWRTWYAWLMASPLLGPQLLQRRPDLIAGALRGDHDPMSKSDARVFADRLSLPEQAQATQALYRSYLGSLVGEPLSRPYD